MFFVGYTQDYVGLGRRVVGLAEVKGIYSSRSTY